MHGDLPGALATVEDGGSRYDFDPRGPESERPMSLIRRLHKLAAQPAFQAEPFRQHASLRRNFMFRDELMGIGRRAFPAARGNGEAVLSVQR